MTCSRRWSTSRRADTGCASCSSTRRPTSWFAGTAALVAVTRSPTRPGSLTEAIERERLLFEPVKADADVVVDTGDLNVHQLRDRLLAIFGGEAPAPGMQTTIRSFGYKHGLPLDADMVIDCRFLPNPYWDEDLRALSGLDLEVRTFVMQQEATIEFLSHLDALLTLLLPAYVREGKSYLSLAFGCTGGQHRSVVVAEEVARRLRQHGYQPVVVHRDIDK